MFANEPSHTEPHVTAGHYGSRAHLTDHCLGHLVQSACQVPGATLTLPASPRFVEEETEAQ